MKWTLMVAAVIAMGLSLSISAWAHDSSADERQAYMRGLQAGHDEAMASCEDAINIILEAHQTKGISGPGGGDVGVGEDIDEDSFPGIEVIDVDTGRPIPVNRGKKRWGDQHEEDGE